MKAKPIDNERFVITVTNQNNDTRYLNIDDRTNTEYLWALKSTPPCTVFEDMQIATNVAQIILNDNNRLKVAHIKEVSKEETRKVLVVI